MKQKLFLILTALLAVFSGTGCRTDYTQEAAETAREYALEKVKGLTEEQRHYIRYTQPVLYSNLIFAREVVPLTEMEHVKVVKTSRLPVDPGQDMMHHCFVWAPPGLDSSVVVAGTGERSLRFWSPIRALLKNYIPDDADYESAKASSHSFLNGNKKDISVPEQNRIRFSEAEVRYTRFPKTWNTEAKVPTPWEQYVKELKERTRIPEDKAAPEEEIILTQLSLVWRSADNPEEYIVFTGFSRNGCLNGWHPQSITRCTEEELAAATLSEQEIAAISKVPSRPAGEQVFPPEPKVKRGNHRKETGSIFGKNFSY